MQNKLRDWFNKHFVDWQAKTGKRQTLDTFAAYLGVSRSTLSKYMNGNSRPGGQEFIEKIAEKLGPEIYDLIDKPRPDPDLTYIIRRWGELSKETRRAILEQAKKQNARSDKTGSNLAGAKS